MAIADHSSAGSQPNYAPDLQAFVFVLFFAFGGITSLNDVLVPKLKELFALSYGEVMLVQSAYFAAYFIISIPAAALVRRVGYMRSAVVGLLSMAAGCILFIPASSQGLFALFLLALFVLAAGVTTVQVVANPLISLLGRPATASSSSSAVPPIRCPLSAGVSLRQESPVPSVSASTSRSASSKPRLPTSRTEMRLAMTATPFDPGRPASGPDRGAEL